MPAEDSEGDIIQTLERIRGTIVRRKLLIAAAATVIAIATIAASFQISNQYTSTATIIIDEQKVSERYVVPTTTSDINQALDAITHEVLSRPQLLAIMKEFQLYGLGTIQTESDSFVELMRRDLSIEPLAKSKSGGNTFKISFTASSPELARKVTTKLTALFIDQNLKTRSDHAATTTVFLSEQLEIAKEQLTQQERRLRDFKMQYLGELPEQQQGNVNILAGLQRQQDNIMTSRNQAQQQRVYLESLVAEYRRIGARGLSGAVTGATAAPDTPENMVQQDVIRLESELRALLTRYSLQHPDVLKKEQEVKMSQATLNALKSSQVSPPVVGQDERAVRSSTSEDSIGVAQLTSQLQANALLLEGLAKSEEKLRTEIDQYRNRLNMTPVREQQITAMQRDYELRKQHYSDLLRKEQESELAASLEKRREGQQFRLADPPNLPGRASSPNRLRISIAGILGGTFLGCALALLLDARNMPFYNVKSASQRLSLRVVVGVPMLLTPAQQRHRTIKRMLELGTTVALILVLAGAEFYVYTNG